ncbi:MAG: zinc ribbon domain-containing protein [Methanobrevibacter sp.]|nr:zinc ribbon domain-containing protein [Methanobrevibacter sp.]
MICPGCGEAIADDLNFCPSCGMELDSLNCPSCGAKNNKKSKYCHACGKSLNYANTIDYSNGKIDNGEGGTEGPFKGDSRSEKGIQGPFEGDSRSSDVMKGPFDD